MVQIPHFAELVRTYSHIFAFAPLLSIANFERSRVEYKQVRTPSADSSEVPHYTGLHHPYSHLYYLLSTASPKEMRSNMTKGGQVRTSSAIVRKNHNMPYHTALARTHLYSLALRLLK